jgi:hypothetical protein
MHEIFAHIDTTRKEFRQEKYVPSRLLAWYASAELNRLSAALRLSAIVVDLLSPRSGNHDLYPDFFFQL